MYLKLHFPGWVWSVQPIYIYNTKHVCAQAAHRWKPLELVEMKLWIHPSNHPSIHAYIHTDRQTYGHTYIIIHTHTHKQIYIYTVYIYIHSSKYTRNYIFMYRPNPAPLRHWENPDPNTTCPGIEEGWPTSWLSPVGTWPRYPSISSPLGHWLCDSQFRQCAPHAMPPWEVSRKA